MFLPQDTLAEQLLEQKAEEDEVLQLGLWFCTFILRA